MSNSTRGFLRLRCRLSEYNLDVIHGARIKLQATDALSRLPTIRADISILKDELPLLAVETTDLGAPAVHFIDAHEIDHQQNTTTRIVLPTEESNEDNNRHPSSQNFVPEQSLDSFCQVVANSVGQRHSEYSINYHGFLIRRSMLNGSIQTLRKSILYLSHHAPVAKHPGQRRMYGTLRREFYWPHIANDK